MMVVVGCKGKQGIRSQDLRAPFVPKILAMGGVEGNCGSTENDAILELGWKMSREKNHLNCLVDPEWHLLRLDHK